MYEYMISEHLSGNYFSGWEPAFKLLIELLAMLSLNEVSIVRFMGFLYIAVLLYTVSSSDKLLLFFLAYYFIPAYIFSHGMNVLRLGLGCSLVLVALNMRDVRQAIFLVFSALFQYSLILVAILKISVQINVFKIKRWLLPLSLVSLCLALMIIFNMEYLLEKMSLYSQSTKDEGLSGTGKILSLVLLFLYAATSGLGKAFRYKFTLIYGSLIVFGWYLSQFTYAGLRFLDLISFAAPVVLILQHRKEAVELNFHSKILIIVAGLVTFLSSLRGYYLTFDEGHSPFLPYNLIW